MKKDEDSPADIRNNVIIKNLEYDEREKNDSNVTLQLIHSVVHHVKAHRNVIC
jgi:hypothetical protein